MVRSENFFEVQVDELSSRFPTEPCKLQKKNPPMRITRLVIYYQVLQTPGLFFVPLREVDVKGFKLMKDTRLHT